ncbi:hypothetical protein MSAN_00295500 [Mycena sanguinolenta]|uniref:DUF5648 domain-containing protein n=1 Tax=Mycena sanguinolenta TaxID=230812 RepID=A0A8H7DK23_9AGAR|nr:hypothetical protein MSAN_00295500 [Mycena sanguinolenta]
MRDEDLGAAPLFLQRLLLLSKDQFSPRALRNQSHPTFEPQWATCGDVSDLAPFVELYVAPVTTHVYTIYDKNITSSFVDSPSGTQFLGIAAFIFSIQDTSTVPFYCLHSAAQTAYFYTTNETEREAALATGFVDYMIAGYIYPSQICGSVPLYRLHLLAANLANSDYMYTTSETDRENAITLGFTYEGIAGYVYDLLSCEALPARTTFSLLTDVGLAATINNLHTPSTTATERSAETCGDPDDALPWFRIHEAPSFAYSYSTDPSFISSAILHDGYVLETIMGRVFLTQEESTVPCYFLTSGTFADNFVTTNATERDTALTHGYTLLPTFQTYIYPTQICGSIPMYRLYNSAETSNFFTVLESERLSAISSRGYADLGIAGYILPEGVAC